MSRLPPLTSERFTDTQKRLFDAITGGKRAQGRKPEEFLMPDGGMRGPFNAWLHHPEIGEAAQRMGEILRFEGNLPDPLREVAILTVGRHWRAQYEWWAHAKIAAKVGVPDDVIQAIFDQAPLPTEDAATLAVHAFVRELMETQHVSGPAYEDARDVLGESGVVELVMLAGYYGLISATLNAFEVGLPEGETPPFAYPHETF
ncbi:MAG: carboxymuconolactone decarboxylase family protein [Magnetovibrio sp.]|nr:carboxymuconolactone decarboxylase family protein [Magnetovibrio sp.]